MVSVFRNVQRLPKSRATSLLYSFNCFSIIDALLLYTQDGFKLAKKKRANMYEYYLNINAQLFPWFICLRMNLFIVLKIISSPTISTLISNSNIPSSYFYCTYILLIRLLVFIHSPLDRSAFTIQLDLAVSNQSNDFPHGRLWSCEFHFRTLIVHWRPFTALCAVPTAISDI